MQGPHIAYRIARTPPVEAFKGSAMSASIHDPASAEDPVESVTRSIPVVIPLAGAILIFLLAFIAVTVA